MLSQSKMKPNKTVTGRRRKLSTFGLLILIILVGQTNSIAQYALEKVDEFKINSLYTVAIVDYYPQDKLYLGYINASEGTRIVLITFRRHQTIIGRPFPAPQWQTNDQPAGKPAPDAVGQY